MATQLFLRQYCEQDMPNSILNPVQHIYGLGLHGFGSKSRSKPTLHCRFGYYWYIPLTHGHSLSLLCMYLPKRGYSLPHACVGWGKERLICRIYEISRGNHVQWFSIRWKYLCFYTDLKFGTGWSKQWYLNLAKVILRYLDFSGGIGAEKALL